MRCGEDAPNWGYGAMKPTSNDASARAGSTAPDAPQSAEPLNWAQFYHLRAAECRDIARTASDRETRDEWLRLANQWTYLALHSGR